MNAHVGDLGQRTAQSGRPIAILIVDDSVVVRRVLAKVFADDPRFHVAGAVASGEQALEFAHGHPIDLVLLDMNLPGQDGLAVLPKLLTLDRNLQVVLLSAGCREGSEMALRALALGAADVVAKPSAGHFSDGFVDYLIDRIVHLEPAAERAGGHEQIEDVRLRAPGAIVRAIGIGGSTGGVGAVTSFLAALPAHLPVPVFVTQHLPANFQPLFAEQLRRACPLGVVIAEEGMAVQPGVIHVAPGRAHLSLHRNARGHVAVQLTTERCLHGGFPAVDPMFAALAQVYSIGACGVILSGMGRDGLAGAQAVVKNGGWMVAQDHQTSAVWGMPGSVVRAGLASAVAPPAALAAVVLEQRQVAA